MARSWFCEVYHSLFTIPNSQEIISSYQYREARQRPDLRNPGGLGSTNRLINLLFTFEGVRIDVVRSDKIETLIYCGDWLICCGTDWSGPNDLGFHAGIGFDVPAQLNDILGSSTPGLS